MTIPEEKKFLLSSYGTNFAEIIPEAEASQSQDICPELNQAGKKKY